MSIDTIKRCAKCGRDLPIERFVKGHGQCKNCWSTYISETKGTISKESIVKIERLYKNPLPERVLDIKQAGIKTLATDECFVRLIDYKRAWISNYGRALEYNGKKYVLKRLKTDRFGEKVCTLQENVYNGKRWVFQKKTIEVWRLVVYAFIVNFDYVGNTHCWHKDNNKADNCYKNIYPVTEKQYNAISERFINGQIDSEDMIFEIINSIAYKENDWYTNKWKRTTFGIGYLGCNDTSATDENAAYIKWANMMQRCYNEEVHKNKPYYANCTADVEWHNFSNYREWHRKNYMSNVKIDLDKDILINGNTVYGAETCTLIPHFVNMIFESRGTETSIVLNKDTGKYDVTMIVSKSKKQVGTFDTYEEAKNAYIDYRENYIRSVAKKLKGKIPYKAYSAMMNCKIDITK